MRLPTRVLGSTCFVLGIGLPLRAQVTPTPAAPAPDTALVTEMRDRFQQQRQQRPPNRSLAIARAIPRNASLATLRRTIPLLITEIGKASRADRGDAREALYLLRRQPRAVQAIAAYFNGLPDSLFPRRLLTLQVVGELQRPDAIPLLQQVLAAALPPRDSAGAERTTDRAQAEMLMATAVEALAFVRGSSDIPDSSAMALVVDVAQRHESRSVRIAAIDAYMWNHGDSTAAGERLAAVLPPEYQPYIDRPRFQGGVPAPVFAERLDAWRRRWGQVR